eukprot:scaffold266178_cov40-Attheya_sp.AAC.1
MLLGSLSSVLSSDVLPPPPRSTTLRVREVFFKHKKAHTIRDRRRKESSTMRTAVLAEALKLKDTHRQS